MAEPGRRRRRILVALAIVVALLGIGAIVAWRMLQPERLTRFLITETKSTLGAKLDVARTAGFDLWPKLHLVLPQPSLTAENASTPFVVADSADIVVPWSTLWNDRIVIEGVTLIRPRLDVDALDAWLASRPASGPMPDVRFDLDARDGTIVAGDRTIATGVGIDLATTGDVLGWLGRVGRSGTRATLPPLAGSARAKTLDVDGTHVEGLRVETHDDDGGSR